MQNNVLVFFTPDQLNSSHIEGWIVQNPITLYIIVEEYTGKELSQWHDSFIYKDLGTGHQPGKFAGIFK